MEVITMAKNWNLLLYNYESDIDIQGIQKPLN